MNQTSLAARLQALSDDRLAALRHGDRPLWEQALADLPDVQPLQTDLAADAVRAGPAAELEPAQREALDTALRALIPWRKGPFELFGLHIDSEWRSDWKWQRLAPHITPLRDRDVLDVGCGNGYHCFRMAGAGARSVTGIDPTLLFHYQFRAVQAYLRATVVHHLALALEDLPPACQGFDTVFSMGVLYHRRDPHAHLAQLRDCLRPAGELVLETLIVEDRDSLWLEKGARYARMRNVWCIPNTQDLLQWLERAGFVSPRVVDLSPTTTDEQRSTTWMPFESLAEALDPSDPSRTVEDLPTPLRAIVIARKS